MKRKDVLSKDEIIDLIGSCDCFRDSGIFSDVCDDFASCDECMRNYLNEDVETVPRYTLIKQNSDLDLFYEKWYNYCDYRDDCFNCPYNSKNKDFEPYSISCFINYLKEGVYQNEKI